MLPLFYLFILVASAAGVTAAPCTFCNPLNLDYGWSANGCD